MKQACFEKSTMMLQTESGNILIREFTFIVFDGHMKN